MSQMPFIDPAVLDEIHNKVHQYEHVLAELQTRLTTAGIAQRIAIKALKSVLQPNQVITIELDTSQPQEQLLLVENDPTSFIKKVDVFLDSTGALQIVKHEE